MAAIELIETGLIYRNPKPHMRSIHAWHPSLVALDNGRILAVFRYREDCIHTSRRFRVSTK